MKRNSIPLFFLIFFNFSTCFSQETQTKDTLHIGVWVESIYNIHYDDRTFESVFWIWINSSKETYDLARYVDIVNAVEQNSDFLYTTKLKNGQFHSECKIRGKFMNKFDVNRFPFDHSTLEINIEFIKDAFRNFVVVFDTTTSNFLPENLHDFDTKSLKPRGKILLHKYRSNFGNSDMGKYVGFHTLQLKIDLNRKSWSLAFKLFFTLLISTVLASVSILLPFEQSEEKFALIVGSLFTAIGNKYITDGMLPLSGRFSLSDCIHMVTFIFILIGAIQAVIEQRYKINRSNKSDLRMFIIVIISYLITTITIIETF
jgi:hypothetical protein